MKMVRLLCHTLTVPCRGQPDAEAGSVRSYLGTGDYIDEKLALKAVQAMSHPEDHSFSSESDSNFSNTESGSNSDSDGDHGLDGALSIIEEEDISITNKQGKDDQRKIRRRERNKISAQAYRRRRKQQSSSQQKVLDALENRQQELLQQIRGLEEQKTIVEELLKKKVKIPWPWPYHGPTGYHHSTTTGMTPVMETVTMDAPMPMDTDVSITS